MPRSAFAFVIVLVAAGIAGAEKSGPTTRPDFPKQLLGEVLTHLHQAQSVTVEVDCRRGHTAAEPIASVEDQTYATALSQNTYAITLERPRSLRIDIKAAGQDGCIELFDGRQVAFFNDLKKHSGHLSDLEGSVDDFLRARGGFTTLVVPEITRLLGGDSVESYFRYVDRWNWLGGAMDLGFVPVWRFEFTDPDDARWQIWVTQREPRRVTRVITDRPSSVGVPSGAGYKTVDRREYVFTNWSTTTPIRPDRWALPKANLKKRPFDDSKSQIRVGDVVPLTPLPGLDGKPIDPSQQDKLVLLDFWFKNCGACIASMPATQRLARERGVMLYTVNGDDSPAEVSEFLEKKGWRDLPVLIDAGQSYQKLFDIKEYPTTVLLTPAGKVLYIGHPSTELGRRQLATAIEQYAAAKQ